LTFTGEFAISNYYTDSEEELLWRFERLFRFEFYLRYIQLDKAQKCEYDKLKQLPDKIKTMADELFTKEGIAFEDIDSEEMVKDMVGEVVGYVLYYLQFGRLSGHNKDDRPDEIDKIILELCLYFKSNYDIKLKSDFYYFSSLAYENKIVDVIKWWDFIRNSDISAGLEGLRD